MHSKTIILHDNINSKDKLLTSHFNPFFRTQIIAGYDPYLDKMGNTRFGTTVFEKENMVLLGGSIFTLEKLFGIRMDPTALTVSQLMDVFTTEGKTPPSVWDVHNNNPHDANNVVCLFGVGIGGAGDSIADVADVKYYQRNISSMVPLRQVTDDSDLTRSEHESYFCRSENSGVISYYLKKFDNVSIKCKWRDSDEEASGSSVTSDYYNTSPSVTTPIETYVELTLKITEKDIREYFDNNDNVEMARLNTIGLYAGVPKNLSSPIPVQYDASTGNTEPFSRTFDYDQVTCFSALNFDNEMLSMPKELTIIYRIFTK